VAEFSGLKSTSCVTYAINARDSSFFDVVAAQLTPKVNFYTQYLYISLDHERFLPPFMCHINLCAATKHEH
jgi:hypothetical protein